MDALAEQHRGMASMPGTAGESQPLPHPLGTQTLKLCQLLQLFPSRILPGTQLLHLSFHGDTTNPGCPWPCLFLSSAGLSLLSWNIKWHKSHNFSFTRSNPSDFLKVIFLLIFEDKWQDNTHLKYKWTAASDQKGSEKRVKGKWWQGTFC